MIILLADVICVIDSIHQLCELISDWSNQPYGWRCCSEINNKLSTFQSINVLIKGDKGITLKLIFA